MAALRTPSPFTRRHLVGVVLFAIFAAACGGGADPAPSAGGTAPAPAPELKVLKLGAIVPTSGPNASNGQEMAASATLAVEQWAERFASKGFRLEINVQDDASDPKQAVAAAYSVTGDSTVFGIVAHLNSGCFLPSIPVYQQAGVMAISPAATNVDITAKGVQQVARVVPHDGVQGQVCADFAHDWLKKQKVAIIHDKTQYGQGIATVFQDRAKALSMDVLSFDGINVGEKDFKALLTKVRESKPELVFFGGLYDEGGFLVKQMRELSMDAVFFGPDGVWGQDFIDVGGASTDGAIVSSPGLPVERMPSATAYREAYQGRFGKPVQNYGPYAYDAANVLIAAAWKAIGEGKENELRAAVVANARAIEHEGATGQTKFDEKGDTLRQSFSFQKVEGGAWHYLATATAGKGIEVLTDAATAPAAPPAAAAGGESAPSVPAGEAAAPPPAAPATP